MSEEPLTKRDKLAIAGYAAHRLRGTRRRPIKTVDADGNVVREVDTVKLAEKVLERAHIEFEVELSRQRTTKNCSQCGLPFFIPKRKTIVKGGGGERSAKYCQRCRFPPCNICGLPSSANSAENARRKGGFTYCHTHAGGKNRFRKGRIVNSCKRCGKACGKAVFCAEHRYGRRAAWMAKYRGRAAE